jgi:ABC-2 type transport system permease protein
MSKLWLFAKHEYRRNVRRRSFILGTLGIPLFIIAVMGISIILAVTQEDTRPVGYVDEAGVLAPGKTPDEAPDVELRAFADRAAAQAALQAQTIQAYYVLPADYLEQQTVLLFYWEESPEGDVQRDFDRLVRVNLAATFPAEVERRLVGGINLTLRSANGEREISGDEGINLLLPGLAGMFFLFAVMNSAGYLLQATTDEKENRTIEIMVTSSSPGQMIGGKALGLIAVAFTQLLIWGGVLAVLLPIGARYLEALRAIEAPWDFLLIVLLFFLPSYALIAGVMIAIGGMVSETRQGQQIAGVINLLFTAPFFFIAIALANPDSPLLVFLTLFPASAFMTIAMRWSLTLIPAWQLIVSWAVLVFTAILSVWAAGRIFRAGMLRYGQRLDVRALWQAVRSSRR